MNMARRRVVLAASALVPLLAAWRAKADTTDLAVICDLTMGPPLRTAATGFRASSGIRVHVFPTAPGLIVPQLAREVQIDIVVTQLGALEQAARAGLLAAAEKSAGWRDTLVVAELAGATGSPDAGKFAVSELPAASGIDGAAIVARLGLNPARILSAIDTNEVAFLLTSGAADAGLLYLTDVRADPRLRVVRTVEEQSKAVYAAAVTRGARRPNPAAFVSYLGTPQARALLTESGLEVVA